MYPLNSTCFVHSFSTTRPLCSTNIRQIFPACPKNMTFINIILVDCSNVSLFVNYNILISNRFINISLSIYSLTHRLYPSVLVKWLAISTKSVCLIIIIKLKIKIPLFCSVVITLSHSQTDRQTNTRQQPEDRLFRTPSSFAFFTVHIPSHLVYFVVDQRATNLLCTEEV